MKPNTSKGDFDRRSYSVPEAAAVSGLGVMAVYRGVKDGTIPHIRSGRKIIIPKQAFHSWIDTAGGMYAHGGTSAA